MTQAATVIPLIGSAPIGNWFTPDTAQRHPLGTIVSFTDPFWGGGEVIYLQAPLSTFVRVGAVLAYDPATSFLAANMANTANLGKAASFALNSVASNATPQFIWAVISGQHPVWSNSSVAADTGIGIVASGQAGAVAAGKSIQHCRVTKPATSSVAKPNTQTQAGSSVIRVSNTDGWFVGVSVSGTGIATSLISGIDADNRTVTLASNATASGSVTATGTYNDATNFFNVCTFSRPSMQGPTT